MKNILLILCLFFLSKINAQINESLSSDRPGQAISTSIVGKNVFQIQPGIDYFNKPEVFLPNSYFRFGLSDKIELNSGLIYSLNNGVNNLESFTLGTRIRLNKIESKTTSAVQVSFNLPLDNLEFSTQAIYTISSNFSDKLSWTANLGATFDKDFEATGLYVLNLTHAINDVFGFFLESFGQLSNNSNLAFDTGMYYLVNNNFQLDFLIGDNEGLFFGTGFTYRFLPKK